MKRSIFSYCLLSCLLIPALSQQPDALSPFATQPKSSAAKVVRPPELLSSKEAEMPPEARKHATNGICVVRLIVDVKGQPQNLRVLRCSDPIFEANSLSALALYKFKPAIDEYGRPVASEIAIEVNFNFLDNKDRVVGHPLKSEISCALNAPHGATGTSPDESGIFPLSERLQQPEISKLIDRNFSDAAVALEDGASCEILLTIGMDGHPRDPVALHCDRANLVTPAVETLMSSHYKAAKLNGKKVSVRVQAHLAYHGFQKK